MYHIIFLFVFIVVLSSSKKTFFRHLSFFMIAYMISFMPDEIPDVNSYYLLYTQPYTSWLVEGQDPGFLLVNLLGGQILSLSFQSFLLVMTFVLMEIWYFYTRKLLPQEFLGTLFLLFLSYNGFFYLGVTLRNACSLIICYIALIEFLIIQNPKKYFYFFLFLFFSISLHISSMIFIIIPVLDKIRIDSKRLRTWLMVDALFLIFGGLSVLANISQLFMGLGHMDKYEDSFDDTQGGTIISLWFFMNLLITLFLVYGRKYVYCEKIKNYDFFLKIIMTGFMLNCIGWQMSIIQRLAGAFYFFNFIPLYILLFNSSLFKSKLKKNQAALSISSFCFAVLLYCQSFLLYY